jgi:hypothetical protein
LKWFEGLEEAVGEQVATLTPERREELRTRQEDLIQRYGKAFVKDNGWAAAALGISDNRIGFGKIAEDAATGDVWEVVQSASDSIHAGYRHAYSNPSRPRGTEGFTHIAGPSVYGMWQPAIHTATTLGMQTTLLWNLHPQRGAKPQFLLHAHVVSAMAVRVARASNRERPSLEGPDHTDQAEIAIDHSE